MGGTVDRTQETLEDLGPEVAAEVGRVLADASGDGPPAPSIEVQRLSHKRVFRVRVAGNGAQRSVVIKRLNPRTAQRNRLAAQRWLPWLGLDGVAPELLGAVTIPGGDAIWQIYEDVAGGTLRAHQADRECVAAAVDLIAAIHKRAASQPVVCECRRDGEDFGIHHFTSNLRDALSVLEALRPPVVHPSPEQAALRDRLRRRLERLLGDAARREATLVEEGGPDTLLHGDLWAPNVLILPGGERTRVRVIDWDHVGAGPISYDLSCFLSRFPTLQRGWILDRYRHAVAGAGLRLPAAPVLNLLFETAECGRCANRIIWPAIALIRDGVDWGFGKIAEIEQWFEALEPVLPA